MLGVGGSGAALTGHGNDRTKHGNITQVVPASQVPLTLLTCVIPGA